MATVTGSYSPEESEERFSRRGRGAGQFVPPGTNPNPQSFLGGFVSNIQGMLGGIPGMGGLFTSGAPVITGNYDPNLAQAAAAQAQDPRLTGDVQSPGANVTTGGGGRGSGTGQQRVTSGAGGAPVPPTSAPQQRRGLPGLGRAAFIGGMIPGVLVAGAELQEGRPTGAAAALTTGTLTSGIGTALLKAPNPLAKIAGGALMLAGTQIPGMAASGAESVRQKVTGEPTKGKEQEFSTQMAMRGQMLQQDLTSLERTLGVNLNATKDLAKFYSDQDLYNLQRMEPVLARMKNNEVVRQQALMNTQGQNYAMLGTLATAGQLATGAQAERGALMRTALTANPYASSTLQAPSISYG